MPSRVIRLVLALLLALLVPLQGFAAVSAGICQAIGHHDMAAEHAHDEGEAHGPSYGAPHKPSPEVPPSDAHCAPCVACCAAAAIAPSVPAVFADWRADAVNAATPPPLSGIQPALLERPPLAL